MRGTLAGKLEVANATYIDLSGKSISGRISVRQIMVVSHGSEIAEACDPSG
jgi:hypothetical protein